MDDRIVCGAHGETPVTFTWQQLGRWDYDADARTLTVSGDGRVLVADVRLVGSYAARSATFQWAWVLHGADDPTSGLQAFGEIRGIDHLTRRWWECPVGEAWAMTALAGYLLGCQGVFRAPFDDAHGTPGGLDWFMLLDGWRAG